ncbi:unnamed protein product, partial [Polarella glacialis]
EAEATPMAAGTRRKSRALSRAAGGSRPSPKCTRDASSVSISCQVDPFYLGAAADNGCDDVEDVQILSWVLPRPRQNSRQLDIALPLCFGRLGEKLLKTYAQIDEQRNYYIY